MGRSLQPTGMQRQTFRTLFLAFLALIAQAVPVLANTPPVGFTGTVLFGVQGVPLSGQAVGGFDANGDPLTFSLANGSTLPAGLTLNPDGSLTGTCNTVVDTAISFQVSDGTATSDAATFFL